MAHTFRAMQASKPGYLELVTRPIPQPGPQEVLLKVEACGVCGADISDIENSSLSKETPRIPGHEVVGRINALGEGVSNRWKIGQRVGVGRLAGHCNDCKQCRQGQFQLCEKQDFVGASLDGGYAEMMIAKASGLVTIPDELSSEEAAPILCAGIATFNALRKSGAEAGDTVAILGIGGLGHMAVQYARKMGFRVVAIARKQSAKQGALELGAHHFIDSSSQDAAAILQAMGGAKAIISTIGNAESVSSLLGGLAPRGRMVLLGAGKDPLALSRGAFVAGEKGLQGSLTGSPYENEKVLKFSVLVDVRPKIEVLALTQAQEAYQRIKRGDIKFRLVLTPPV